MKRIDNTYQRLFPIAVGVLLFFLIIGNTCIAQEPLQNFGNLKIHDGGAIGFHGNLINNGITDDNSGIAGFYNDNTLTISGAFRPIFQDMEIMVTNDLFLNVGVGVTNNSNFVIGNVITPRNLLDVTLDYWGASFYTGEANTRKVDGYAASTNKANFVFPVGDANKLRPLELFTNDANADAKCAYFFEDPNTPSTLTPPFNTGQLADILVAVSSFEYWDLDADVPVSIALSWDTDSNLPSFVDRLEDLRIVGWNTQDGLWENLGGNSISGSLDSGRLISDLFVPNNYSVLTFGTSLSTDTIDLGNYLVTPNGDGINDFLYFEAISLSPNNDLKIFNRWGRLVYYNDNYENNFDGNSNQNHVVVSNKSLPDGIYFYILDLKDIGVKHQGFLSLNH